MNCEHFQDDYELYVLGALENAQEHALEEHLAGGCQECRAAVWRAVEMNETILSEIPQVTPRPELRKRVLQTFAETPAQAPRFGWPWNFAWAAAALAIISLASAFAIEHSARLREEAHSKVNAQELARVSSMMEILQAPGTKQVSFGPAETPHGSLFVHQKLGIIMIAGGLPAAPAGWSYESWVVPKTGAPKPIEAFQAASNGRAMSMVPGPLDLADLKAVAVSLEPNGAPVTKPTKVIFAAMLGS